MGQDIKQASNVTVESLLKQLANSRASGCLQVSCKAYSSISFFLYFWEGKLSYATNSLAPFERLERHLRRLSNQNTKLTNQVIREIRNQVENNLHLYQNNPADYQGILWLTIEKQYLKDKEVTTLLRRIIREVFESLLSLPEPIIYKFVENKESWSRLGAFDIGSFVEQCQKRIQAWQVFTSHIQSSYERLYLASGNNTIPNLTPDQKNTICKLLKGLTFRQISALIDKDELIVARLLYPAIVDGGIIIRTPKQPFNKLPKLPSNNLFENIDNVEEYKFLNDQEITHKADSKETIQAIEKQWKIACIDDSVSIQHQAKEILDSEMFSLVNIMQPMNALAELIEFKPELILLDIDMPNISGYELCSLLRSHNEFKSIPIIMLTEERGLINLTKSKLVGATDYLIKPFDQSSLFKVIFKYLQ